MRDHSALHVGSRERVQSPLAKSSFPSGGANQDLRRHANGHTIASLEPDLKDRHYRLANTHAIKRRPCSDEQRLSIRTTKGQTRRSLGNLNRVNELPIRAEDPNGARRKIHTSPGIDCHPFAALFDK